jgi:hypothetical protein
MSLSEVAVEAQDAAAGAWLVVVIAAIVAQIVLFVAGVVSVVRSSRLTTTGRLVWVLAMLVFPLVGPIVWFAWGRRGTAQIYRSGT